MGVQIGILASWHLISIKALWSQVANFFERSAADNCPFWSSRISRSHLSVSSGRNFEKHRRETMIRLTIPAALTIAVVAAPFWSLSLPAEDAHHPAQGTPAEPTQAPVQSIPSPAAPPAQAQAPVPQPLQAPSAQAPATGQAPTGSQM